jgi:hypothetical protein
METSAGIALPKWYKMDQDPECLIGSVVQDWSTDLNHDQMHQKPRDKH